ncbi:uncharacterized protein LOC131949022 [Physella acuta]|uniref:uncharacterized protein LOC131949022 n=1 Tax=Physella acuta TaxID=109671 RepID=UPI0027DD4F9C|nr:uncharacterized protein LOC131949022 [Physella acuta]
MDSETEEEVEALKAIYCKEGEFFENRETWVIQVNFDLRSQCNKLNFGGNTGVSFCLKPQHIPECTVVCSLLPKVKLQQLQDQLQAKAQSLQGQPMIMELCCLAEELLRKEVDALVNLCSTDPNMFYPCLQPDTESESTSERQPNATHGPDGVTLSMCPENHQAHFSSVISHTQVCHPEASQTKYLGSRTSNTSDTPSRHLLLSSNINISHVKTNESSLRTNNTSHIHAVELSSSTSHIMTALLQLDHMRSKQSYVKLIKKWTTELSLTGRLIFLHKIILILIQGDASCIKDYIIRNRTCNVDVDSKGRSCKEKMLSVLCELQTEISNRFPDFCILELESATELQTLFYTSSLKEIFDEFLGMLVHIK